MLSTHSVDAAFVAPDTGTGWRMVARGLVAQNVAAGCAFGSAAIALVPLQERYDVGRGVAGFGLSLIALTFSLLGPLVAWLVTRIGLQRTMLLGLSLSGLGYVALAFAPSITLALAAFGLLVGPGLALFGPLPASLLASSWITHRRGFAVGLVNVNALVMVVPLVGAAIIARHGLAALYLCLALLHLLILPVVLGIRSPPHHALQGNSSEGAGSDPVPAERPLTTPFFWVMSIGGGLLGAVAVIASLHVVALAAERGATATHAAMLASLAGMSSIPGALLAGPLCDRLGAARTLALAGLGMMTSWILFFVAGSSLVTMAAAILIAGMCGGGIYPAINLLSLERFGIDSVGRVVALFGLCVLPFSFLLPPAAGALYDVAGSYEPVLILNVALSAMTLILFLMLSRRVERPGVHP